MTKGKKNQNYTASKVKTFAVPLTSVEIKENITVTTNTLNKHSKEEIINQGINFHLQGNIEEASKYYQYCLNQNFNDYRVLSNYGLILKSIGNLEDAELYTRKAIELNPDFANAHSNLGIILRNLSKSQEAELSTRKAIEINPKLADAHLTLGNILSDTGKSKEAELSYLTAIKINPKLAEAHLNLGNVLSGIGKSEEAFESYIKAIEINPRSPTFYNSISNFLKDSDPSQLNKSKLIYILNILLEKNDISHKELFKVFNFIYINQINSKSKHINSDIFTLELFSQNKTVLNALKKIIFIDIELEKILTKLRQNICKRIAKNHKILKDYELQFIISLAEQCFLNEYIYAYTENEKILIKEILYRCRNSELNDTNLSILACYIPLFKLLDKIPSLEFYHSPNQNFQELIKLQIKEPLQEIELSKNIKEIGIINDTVSQKVKTQYEENPYPRWKYINPSINQKVLISQAINSDIKPNSISNHVTDKPLRVLIAGCGTGQQILYSQIYKNAKITGIDLSSSSLAYAQRKINELDIKNVELIKMDILEVNLLIEQFDVIECGGVLHHMNDPIKGLKQLLSILKPNGFLKLGLYSKLARRDIVKARKYITTQNHEVNEQSIRNFRNKAISGKFKNLNSLKNYADFYSFSEFRDLCFHTHEHRFTIKEIKNILETNKLKFLGFILPQQAKSLFKQCFPKDKKQISLENWAKYEERNPDTFKRMYQFWVCKTKN